MSLREHIEGLVAKMPHDPVCPVDKPVGWVGASGNDVQPCRRCALAAALAAEGQQPQAYKDALTEACSEILKTVMEAMADSEGGIGIDQVYALVDGHIGHFMIATPQIEIVLSKSEQDYQAAHPEWKPKFASAAAAPSLHKEGLPVLNLSSLLDTHKYQRFYLRGGCTCGWGTTLCTEEEAYQQWIQHMNEESAALHKEGAGGECAYKKQHNIGFPCPHCGVIEPLPLQRTLPDDQFKGTIVEPIGANTSANTNTNDEPFSYTNESLVEDQKLTELESPKEKE